MPRTHELAFTYESTRGDEVVASVEAKVEYTYKSGSPPYYSRSMGGFDPPEGAEIEIVDILYEYPADVWTRPDKYLYEVLEDHFLLSLYDLACDNAAGDLMAERDEAMERRREE